MNFPQYIRRQMKVRRIKKYREQKETIVFGLGLIPEQGIPEIKIRYNRSKKTFLGKVTNSKDSYDFLKKVFDKNTIELQESFVVLYLNRANQILGYYKHSIGGIAGTVADPRIIFATGVASASSGIILSHNHPSGNLTASQADLDITRKLKEGGKLLEIQLLDHVIVTNTSYYSFADEGLI
jgi:DNA repair protein RadC